MSDEVYLKESQRESILHPEGQFIARCADVVNLGERLEQFAGRDPKVTPKVALVWLTAQPEPDPEQAVDEAVLEFPWPGILSREVTLSSDERSNLVHILEGWRGKEYSADELAEGVPLHKLEGVTCLLSVSHNRSAKGKVYANVSSVAPCPASLRPKAPPLTDYKRPDWFAKRKDEYRAEVAKYRALNGATQTPDPESEDPVPF